jgi:hypothetical protein
VEECTRWDNLSRWISFRNPVGRWIGLRCLEFSLCSVRRKDGSRPLDLGPITRQPSDRTGAVRGLPSGVQPSAYRDSQGQENRDTSSLETPGRSEPPVEDTRGGDRGYYRESGYSASGNRSSRGRENWDITSLEIPEKSGPSIRRGRVAAIGADGEGPDRKLLIGVCVIGISGILMTIYLCILESRRSKPR